MLRSMEQMAKEKVMVYIKGLTTEDGVVIIKGCSLEVACRKAAAASPQFKPEIDKILKSGRL